MLIKLFYSELNFRTTTTPTVKAVQFLPRGNLRNGHLVERGPRWTVLEHIKGRVVSVTVVINGSDGNLGHTVVLTRPLSMASEY